MGISKVIIGQIGPSGVVGATGPAGTTGATGATGVTPVGAWTDIPFTAGWGNLGSGWQTCQYRKVDDRVYVRGVANGSGFAVAGMWGALPFAFRPPTNIIFTIIGASSNTNRLDVYTDASGTYYGDLTVWTSLGGLSWSVV